MILTYQDILNSSYDEFYTFYDPFYCLFVEEMKNTKNKKKV